MISDSNHEAPVLGAFFLARGCWVKWFKHETDARSSEKLAQIIDEFGFEGYGRYWRIMEIVAERMDESSRCHAELPEKTWLRMLNVRRPLFHRYLVVIGLLFDNWRITVDNHSLLIRIEIPNLLKKRDNYTSNLEVTNKKLSPRSRSRSNTYTGDTLINFYSDRFTDIFGIKPKIDGGKDGAILKKLAAQHGEAKVKELLSVFLNSDDEFIVKTDRSLRVFMSQVQKLLVGAKQYAPRKLKAGEKFTEGVRG